MFRFLGELFGLGPNPCIVGEQVAVLARALEVTFLPSSPASNLKKCESSNCGNKVTQMAVSKRGGIGIRCCSDSLCMMSAAVRVHTRTLVR